MPFREAWLHVGVFLILLGFGVSEPVITGVGFVIIIVGGISRYWSRHIFDRLILTRTLGERRVFAGEPVSLTVELENRKPLPLPWYEWRLALAEPTSIKGEPLAAAAAPGFSFLVRRGAIGWYERHDWQFELTVAERGYHQYGPAVLRSADLLGLFPRRQEDTGIQRLVVFPRVYTLPELGLPAERPFGERKGGNPIFEDPLRIAGLREYRPGDSLRRIDWKATARTGELHARVYEPSAAHQLYIFLNVDTLAHSWEGYLREELERAVSTAASIATWAGGQRFAVGLLANGAFPDADRPIRLPPSRSRDQLTRVLEALAMVQPLTLTDLAGVIHREMGKIPAGSTLVVVASLLPESLAAAIRRLQDEGHRVYVVGTSDRVDTSLLQGVPYQSVGRAFARMDRPAHVEVPR
jgi:uncharacterized protein (DUF58 family)